MKVKVEHTPDLTGIDARLQCGDGIASYDVVRVLVPDTRLFVRVYDGETHPGVLEVSEEVWRRMRVALHDSPSTVEVRPITRLEALSRKLTVKHAAALLALLAGLFAAVIGLAPVLAPGTGAELVTVRERLSVDWQAGHVLSQSDVDRLTVARSAASRVVAAADQVVSWVKVVGGVVLILSAFATLLIALKAVDP